MINLNGQKERNYQKMMVHTGTETTKAEVNAMTIRILVKSASNRDPQVTPRPFELENRPKTVGDFLREAVKTCIREYEAEHGVFAALTGQELNEMSQTGKISFEGHNSGLVDTEEAIKNACQCFDDGIVRVVLDEKQLDSLDQEIDITEGSTAIFIRLSMLSGAW